MEGENLRVLGVLRERRVELLLFRVYLPKKPDRKSVV